MPHRANPPNRRLVLRARYVFPVAGRPIANGSVTIEGERIVALGEDCGDGEVRDLGNAAILPGLHECRLKVGIGEHEGFEILEQGRPADRRQGPLHQSLRPGKADAAHLRRREGTFEKPPDIVGLVREFLDGVSRSNRYLRTGNLWPGGSGISYWSE